MTFMITKTNEDDVFASFSVGCDETKKEEEETVADSVAIHTTIKQITWRGGGRWRRLRQ
jgi:hypothetical protein